MVLEPALREGRAGAGRVAVGRNRPARSRRDTCRGRPSSEDRDPEDAAVRGNLEGVGSSRNIGKVGEDDSITAAGGHEVVADGETGRAIELDRGDVRHPLPVIAVSY